MHHKKLIEQELIRLRGSSQYLVRQMIEDTFRLHTIIELTPERKILVKLFDRSQGHYKFKGEIVFPPGYFN